MGMAETLGQTIGMAAACRALGVPRSTLYRHRDPTEGPAPHPASPRRLSEDEQETVRRVLNSERFRNETPRQVYATLLDEGVYLCHWRTMYRILAQHDEVQERRQQLTHPVYTKPELMATRPNELWSWDITKLRAERRLTYYYLYVILDVFSRYVVGWMLDTAESEAAAHRLIAQTCRQEGIAPAQLTLHADRGAAMTAKSVEQLLRDLQVTQSHSRPYTPDDNPFSEAQFKTMKYRPDYPVRFVSYQHARAWASAFFHWYNHQHYPSALHLMTPAMVHAGQDPVVREQRQQVLQAAYQTHPERFVKGPPQLPALPDAVWINPPPPPTTGEVLGRSPTICLAQPASSDTQPSAQGVSRVAQPLAPSAASLDSTEHLTTLGTTLVMPTDTPCPP
jgi:putative transposase